jgi:membrane fusion protein, multidrug efflux system
MVEKQSADGDELTRIDAGATAAEAASAKQESKSPQRDPSSTPLPSTQHRPRWKRTLLIGALAALVLAAIWIYGVPWIQLTLNTVSTDDAYINGHVTFVAARVRGQIARVLVDDNNRVHKGDLLAQLDKEPFQDAVAEKKKPQSILQRRICVRPRPRCAVSKPKPGAYAGN